MFDLTIQKIKVYKQERKIKVLINFDQSVVIQPFGLDSIMNTSELVSKSSVRDIANKVNHLDYFRRHTESREPSLSEIKAAENELKHFIKQKIKSI